MRVVSLHRIVVLAILAASCSLCVATHCSGMEEIGYCSVIDGCTTPGLLRYRASELQQCTDSLQWLPVTVQSIIAEGASVNATCPQTWDKLYTALQLQSELVHRQAEANQELQRQIAILASPVQFASALYCTGNGVRTSSGSCACYEEKGVSFASGVGCAECTNGMDADDTGRCVVDVEAPVITLVGPNVLVVGAGDVYEELGVTVVDNFDVSVPYVVSSTLNSNVPGVHTVLYTATDAGGNSASISRTVYVLSEPTAESLGYIEQLPGTSCKQLRNYDLEMVQTNPSFPVRNSGVYWIRPNLLKPAIEVYCDMHTDGGGWTMVMRTPKGIALQHLTTEVDIELISDLNNSTFSKFSDEDWNLLNASEHWVMCGQRQTVYKVNPAVPYFSNHGQFRSCVYSENFVTEARASPTNTTWLPLNEWAGSCGGGRYRDAESTKHWGTLSGIHVFEDSQHESGGFYLGCYATSDTAIASNVTDPVYTSVMPQCVTWNYDYPIEWSPHDIYPGCSGFTFVR